MVPEGAARREYGCGSDGEVEKPARAYVGTLTSTAEPTHHVAPGTPSTVVVWCAYWLRPAYSTTTTVATSK